MANYTSNVLESQRQAVAEDLARVLSDKPEDLLVMETGGNTLESLLTAAREAEPLQRRSNAYPSKDKDTLNAINARVTYGGRQNVSDVDTRGLGLSPLNPLPEYMPEGHVEFDPFESVKKLSEGEGKVKEPAEIPEWFAPPKEAVAQADEGQVQEGPRRLPPDADHELLRQYFGNPLTMNDYFLRDWFWIRCHSQLDIRISVGGSWPGPHGKNWLRELNAIGCGPIVNWVFEYANGLKWGDAVVRMDWWISTCGIKEVIDTAVKLAKMAGAQKHREFYIYSCPAARDEPGWRNEQAEMARTKEKAQFHGKGG